MNPKKTTRRSVNAAVAVALCALLAVPAQAHNSLHDDIDMSEPDVPEGYEYLALDEDSIAGPPVHEEAPLLIPGNDVHIDVAGLEPPRVGSQSVAACSFSGSTGSSGTEFYRSYEPLGSGGYDGTHSNNIYKVFYVCRTTWTDAEGYKYLFIVTKDRQNSGTSNHIQSTLDHTVTGYYTANHNEWEPGSGESLIDIAPDSEQSFGDGDTVNFALGYGGASVGWSHTFQDGVIKVDYWTGANVHWHTNSHEWGCCGQSGWTSTYGAVQKVPASTYGETSWRIEDRFHHYDSNDSHTHNIYTPCTGTGCGFNTMTNHVGS